MGLNTTEMASASPSSDVQSGIPNKLGRGHFAVSLEQPDSFTIAHHFRDRSVVNTVPWLRCTPDPSLVQRWFTSRDAKAAWDALSTTMRYFEQGANRPLQDDEVAALAFYTSKKMQTIEWYARGAGVLGALLWWRGRKTFKFPMWQAPKDPSVYNVFPTKRMPILTGARARYAWYAQRFTLYMALAVPLGIVIGNSAGTMTQVEGMKTDIRTQELIRQMRQRSHERQRIGQNPPTTESETNGTPYGQMQSDQGFDGSTMSSETERQGSETRIDRIKDSSRDFGGENTRDPYSFPRDTSGSNDRDRYSGSFSSTSSDSSSSFWDDASPTASDELGPSTSTISSDSGSVWDRLRQQTISTSRQESSSSETQSHTPTNPWNASDTSSSQSFQTSTTQSPGSNGSSWQRIRQGQSPVSFQQSRTQDDNNNNNNNNESYSFSSSDEDRALAKEQAQKDFDEMIERERKGGQGGNDDSGGGEGKGWWGKR